MVTGSQLTPSDPHEPIRGDHSAYGYCLSTIGLAARMHGSTKPHLVSYSGLHLRGSSG